MTSSGDYKQHIYDNLPSGITYNPTLNRYFVNFHKFFRFKEAKWYNIYLNKFGYSTVLGYLFSSKQGVWYDPSELSTLFQDAAGTTPVTTAGQPVGLMLDKSGRDNHATQTVLAARPTYMDGDPRLVLDKVDDKLIVTVPTGGWTGTMVLGTPEGTADYGVTIPAGSYDVGSKGGSYFPGTALSGLVIRDGALSSAESALVKSTMVANGAGDTYGAVTDFNNYWRDFSEVTSFPIIDTSSGTTFNNTWRDCTSLTSFPLIDMSSGTNFTQTWRNCTSLTSFPLIDMSSGTNFSNTWRNCTSLTSFPANFFDGCAATSFPLAFTSTALTQTSIDNILVSIDSNGSSNGRFDQSGGSAPSATGEAAITAMRGRGWTVIVTGGF